MQSAIHKIALTYLGLTAVFLGYLGLVWAFAPLDHMARLGISVTEVPGINTLKSIMATGLLGMTGCCMLFLFNQQHWYRPILLLTGVMLLVRLVSLLVDGLHPRMAIYAGLEFLILLMVVAAVKTDPQSRQTSRLN